MLLVGPRASLCLQEQAEGWRKPELKLTRGKLGDLSTQQQDNKVLHGPMSELRATASKPEGEVTADLIRRIFRLGDS